MNFIIIIISGTGSPLLNFPKLFQKVLLPIFIKVDANSLNNIKS